MEKLFSRRNALKLGLAAALLPTVARAAVSPVLVELFTSQGCSDCPPADKLAGELMKEPGNFIVSMNVDYWDYLGWKDTLGSAAWSERQERYARMRGDGDVYTPQMVINGTMQAVGSNRGAVEAAIAVARAKPMAASLSLAPSGNNISVNVAGKLAGHAKVFLLALTPEVSVPIGRGENAGSKVTYHNVARKLVPLGDWNGDAATFTAQRPSVDDSQFLAFVQNDDTGEILGLSALPAA